MKKRGREKAKSKMQKIEGIATQNTEGTEIWGRELIAHFADWRGFLRHRGDWGFRIWNVEWGFGGSNKSFEVLVLSFEIGGGGERRDGKREKGEGKKGEAGGGIEGGRDRFFDFLLDRVGVAG